MWGIWEQNVSINQMVTSSSTLCWAAKWLGERGVMFDSVHQSSEKKMLKGIHKLLDEADVVVSYNGKKFDLPTLNKEFLLNDMAPPSPYKQVDMLLVARGAFRFQSNKLDYVARQLGLGKKTSHEGFQLWVDCMAGDATAWRKMEQYNKNDVVLLEKVYKRMLPWAKGHPSHSTYANKEVCPSCGGSRFQRRGYSITAAGKFARYQCQGEGCGAWSRAHKPEEKNTNRLIGAT